MTHAGLRGDTSAYASVLTNSTRQPMTSSPNQLIISNYSIRRDSAGRYCLNDVHKAAGGEKRHQPSDWLRLQQTQELIAELASQKIPGILGIESKQGLGTFVAKELVYGYAMWISAAFNLKVIQAYDAMAGWARPPTAMSRLELLRLATQAEEEREALESEVKELTPKAEALDRIATASNGSFSLRDAAKTLQIGERRLMLWLASKSAIYRHANGGWQAYAAALKGGYLEQKIVEGLGANGAPWQRVQIRVTARGLARMSKALTAEGVIGYGLVGA